MKKIILICSIMIILALGIIFNINNQKKNNENNNLKKVTLTEVTHSIFYAPQYLADALGYFKDEGLDVEITLSQGADAVMSAVLSGDADIGFCGTEATIYVYNKGEKDYPKTFAGLTKRDGSFIVSRTKIDNFTLNDLKGKHIIGGRKGGMPEMTLEYTLKENGIDPKKDLTIDTSIAFSAMSGAFIGGTGDFVTLFEPNALELTKQNLGYTVAYLGALGGEVPYTAYNARKSYIEKNPDIIKGFSNAIDKALKYVEKENAETIANHIIDYFPNTSLNDLITIVDEYKKGDAWKKDISINEEEWNHIQDIIISAGLLDTYAPYQDLIDTTNFNS